VRVFRQKFTLEDAIGSHACSLEANTRVTNGIPLGSSLFLPVDTVNCVQTLKVRQEELRYLKQLKMFDYDQLYDPQEIQTSFIGLCVHRMCFILRIAKCDKQHLYVTGLVIISLQI
jgi:hypothetical protein